MRTTTTQPSAPAVETKPTQPTSLAEVRDQGTIAVHSTTEPNAAGLLHIGRTTAYAMARTGELPVIRLSGTVRVPVPALLKLLGVEQP
jgi:hypothetical protein